MTRRALLAGVAVVMAAAGCHTSSTPGPDRETSACLNLGGTVVADECKVHDTTTAYEISMRFPTGYPDQEAVADYLTRERKGFIDSANTTRPRSFPFELDVIGEAYRSGDRKTGTESLVFTIGSDTGVHPVTTYKAFDYSLADHAPVTLDTLFKPDSNPVAVLKPYVAKKVLARDRTAGQRVDDLTAQQYEQFAITDDAIIFFFNQDGLLPHEQGPLQVSVPRADLASILN